jgi:hypothetical protein
MNFFGNTGCVFIHTANGSFSREAVKEFVEYSNQDMLSQPTEEFQVRSSRSPISPGAALHSE